MKKEETKTYKNESCLSEFTHIVKEELNLQIL